MAAVMGVSGAAVAHAGPRRAGVEHRHAGTLRRHVRPVARSSGGLPIASDGARPYSSGSRCWLSAAIVVAVVPGVTGYAVGLLLVGLGWSFAFIGSTVLLADATPPERRARVVGRADLAAQLSAAVIAIGGGWWFASRGVAGLGLLAIVVSMVPVLLVAFVRESRPGHYVAR